MQLPLIQWEPEEGADPTPAPNLHNYDFIAISSSGGKDSQAMLYHVVRLADACNYPRQRIHVLHADLGRIEWPGARELAEEQARLCGLDFRAMARPQGDLLAQVRQRRRWPSSSCRYCTSDHKRTQIDKLLVALGREYGAPQRHVHILHATGLRAEESPARSKRPILAHRPSSCSYRTVLDWLPIHAWTKAQVWQTIHKSGLPWHYAYDLGMPRLSCVFCIFAPRPALLLAGRHNPELLQEYINVEREIEHTFTTKHTMQDIALALSTDQQPICQIDDWAM